MLVDMMFYAAVSPLLPRYADELSLSKAQAGLLIAAYPAGTLLGSLPGGWLAARIGVKPTLLAGLGMLGASSLVFGFAGNVVLLDATRFIQGIGGAFAWAAGLAWLVGAAPPDRRGELIGVALAAAVVGVLLGPVVGGLATVVGPEAVFAGVSLLAAALAGWTWATPSVTPRGTPGFSPLWRALRGRSLLVALWVFALPAVFAGLIQVLVPLRLDELGATGVAIGAAFLVASGSEAALSPLTGRLSDRLGRFVLVRAGLGGVLAMSVLMPLPASAVLVAAALVAATAVLGIVWAPAMALVSEASEHAGLDQGLAFALSNVGWSLGHLVGGAGGSALAGATADGVPYALMALLCAGTLATLPLVTRPGRERREAARG